MASRVGAKGNIVIEKSIRDKLGVEPGWETIQLLRDGYVEVHFLPPSTPDSVFGCLRSERGRKLPLTEDALHEATERALAEALTERYGPSFEEREA